MSTPYTCPSCQADLRGDPIPESERTESHSPTHFTDTTIIQRARGWVWQCPACWFSWEPETP